MRDHCLFVCLFTCLFVCLFVYLFVCLFWILPEFLLKYFRSPTLDRNPAEVPNFNKSFDRENRKSFFGPFVRNINETFFGFLSSPFEICCLLSLETSFASRRVSVGDDVKLRVTSLGDASFRLLLLRA